MDRILALDEQPPYLEVYKHAPIMYMAVCEYEAASLGVPPKDWLLWVHGVQSVIDAIAATHGLYKVKAYAQGRSCLFSISPDTPPKEQAAIMLGAAQQLLQALNKHVTPGGRALAVQITIHAGQYAGGIVGKSAWTYELFGDQVDALLAMDAYGTPNTIQLSAEALKLVGDASLFGPRRTQPHGRDQLSLYTLKQEEVTGEAQATASTSEYAGCSREKGSCSTSTDQQQGQWQQPAAPQQQCHEQQQQQQQQQQVGQHSDLRFMDARLEASFKAHHDAQLASMDAVFMGVSLLVAGACWYSLAQQLPHSGVLRLHALLLCVVPVLAAALWQGSPVRYHAWREPLWALHRVLVVADLCSPFLLSSGTGAEGNMATRLLRFGTLTMLVNALGFKLRFGMHCLVTGINVATVLVTIAWLAALGMLSISGLDVGLCCLLGILLPALLVYDWERDYRCAYLSEVRAAAPGAPLKPKAKAA